VRERLEERLEALRIERQAGERLLARLAAEQTEVEHTLLRISGAIQVLEELLATATDPAALDPDLGLLATPTLPEVNTG
jgi:hypothetical protein